MHHQRRPERSRVVRVRRRDRDCPSPSSSALNLTSRGQDRPGRVGCTGVVGGRIQPNHSEISEHQRGGDRRDLVRVRVEIERAVVQDVVSRRPIGDENLQGAARDCGPRPRSPRSGWPHWLRAGRTENRTISSSVRSSSNSCRFAFEPPWRCTRMARAALRSNASDPFAVVETSRVPAVMGRDRQGFQASVHEGPSSVRGRRHRGISMAGLPPRSSVGP